MTRLTPPTLSVTTQDIDTLSPADLAARLRQPGSHQSESHQSESQPSGGTLGSRLGIVLLEASRTQLVATMPVEGNLQPAGRLHGGGSAALVEELASVGSWLNLDVSTQMAVGVDLNITHVRGATGGLVRGVADLVYRGRSVLVWNVTISNEHGKVISTGRCTCNVVKF